MNKRVLILENSWRDLEISRLPLGKYFENQGIHMIYACPNPLDKEVYDISLNSRSFKIFCSIWDLLRLEIRESADVILSFRLVPNILNTFCGLFLWNRKRILVITGLGIAFVDQKSSLKYLLIRLFIKGFYCLASRFNTVITQNIEDGRELCLKNYSVINGSGLSPKRTKSTVKRMSGLNFLYAGRLLKTKGINHAVELFLVAKKKFPTATFTIVGSVDQNNNDSIDEQRLEFIKSIEGIEYLGYVPDISSYYERCNIFLYPSYYREGIPRVLIEALKYGLIIITTDMPGCNQTVKNNGFLLQRNSTVEEYLSFLEGLHDDNKITLAKNSMGLFAEKFSSSEIYPEFLRLIL